MTYYADHRDQALAASRRYRESHQKVLRERDRRYKAAHRESLLAYSRLAHWLGRMEMIERLGGCCAHCGYKDDLRALEIDHIDPAMKTMGLNGARVSALHGLYPAAIRELEKCQLLCANCHAIKSHTEKVAS